MCCRIVNAPVCCLNCHISARTMMTLSEVFKIDWSSEVMVCTIFEWRAAVAWVAAIPWNVCRLFDAVKVEVPVGNGDTLLV